MYAANAKLSENTYQWHQSIIKFVTIFVKTLEKSTRKPDLNFVCLYRVHMKTRISLALRMNERNIAEN